MSRWYKLKPRESRTLLAQRRFLREFAACGNVGRAAQAACVAHRTIYNWTRDASFKVLYEAAQAELAVAREPLS